jgi:hypothetical protein
MKPAINPTIGDAKIMMESGSLKSGRPLQAPGTKRETSKATMTDVRQVRPKDMRHPVFVEATKTFSRLEISVM